MRPRLLDLFAGAGGAAVGYARAGFEVVGVDHVAQPRYPFEFIQADALEVLTDFSREIDLQGESQVWQLGEFDAIHASPPCQAYSWLTRNLNRHTSHADLVAQTRELLQATGLPYVIENVEGAPLLNPARICGSSLGLNLRRHRLWETNWALMVPPCAHGWQAPRFRSLDKRQKSLATIVGVHGHLNYAGEQTIREQAMEIDWMTASELVEAIPPAYTELIGAQLLDHLSYAPAARNPGGGGG